MIIIIIIKAAKSIYIEDLVHHLGKRLIRKTLSRVKTIFKDAHNLNLEDLIILRGVCLGEAIASNNIDITKIYIWKDREIL